MNMRNSATWQQIENVGETTSRMFDIARKKVEGMKRNMPCSQEKKKIRAMMLCSKTQIRKLKGTKVDEEIMKKRQLEAQMEGM